MEDKVLISTNTLTTLGDKAFGENHTPKMLANIVDALGPTGFFNDEINYGHMLARSTSSSAYQGITLPTDVHFNDIVFAMGVGGYNNSSVSARSAQNIHWIYCPAMYDEVLKTDADGTPSERAMFGFKMVNSGSTYESAVWTPNYQSVGTYTTNYRLTLYEDSGALKSHVISTNNLQTYNGYLIAQYGSAVIYYYKG